MRRVGGKLENHAHAATACHRHAVKVPVRVENYTAYGAKGGPTSEDVKDFFSAAEAYVTRLSASRKVITACLTDERN